MADPMDEVRQEARRWVRRKRLFYSLLALWLVLSAMWFAIDILGDSRLDWFWWPMLGMGLGVVVTGIFLLGVGGLMGPDWERRQIDRYVERRGSSGPSRPESLM
jgi:hypothetical protein